MLDWYWKINGQIFSSKRNAYVPENDPDYISFCEFKEPSVIDTEENLFSVLRDNNVPPYAPVSSRQARLALLQAGLLDEVETMIQQGDQATKIAWDYATQIDRSHPLVVQLAQALGLTKQQLDDLFNAAYEIP